MEYFLGAIITLACVFVVNRLVSRQDRSVGSVQFSQSRVYLLMAPFLPTNNEIVNVQHTQSSKYLEQVFVRVVMVGKLAYWIKDNTLYEGDVVEGIVDKKTAREVDTITMDKVQLNKMMSIVERLTEGTHNDHWNSGKS